MGRRRRRRRRRIFVVPRPGAALSHWVKIIFLWHFRYFSSTVTNLIKNPQSCACHHSGSKVIIRVPPPPLPFWPKKWYPLPFRENLLLSKVNKNKKVQRPDANLVAPACLECTLNCSKISNVKCQIKKISNLKMSKKKKKIKKILAKIFICSLEKIFY
jgi:hypothetical protein